MEKIIGKRGSGKTKKLMLYAKEKNALFVCRNPYAMENKAYSYGIIGLTFVDYENFLQNDYHDKDFVIDEKQDFYDFISESEDVITFHAAHLLGYTLTQED